MQNYIPEYIKTARVIQQDNQLLALKPSAVRVLLNLDRTYEDSVIAQAIKQATQRVELVNQFAILPQVINFTHSNPNYITLPKRPVKSIHSIEKLDLKTHKSTTLFNAAQNIGLHNYIHHTTGKFDYISIMPTAFNKEEMQILGISDADDIAEGKKYYKSRFNFSITYEAGQDNLVIDQESTFKVVSNIPKAFENAILAQLEKIFHTTQYMQDIIYPEESRITVSKL